MLTYDVKEKKNNPERSPQPSQKLDTESYRKTHWLHMFTTYVARIHFNSLNIMSGSPRHSEDNIPAQWWAQYNTSCDVKMIITFCLVFK
jgi:hypothetical protein